MFEFEPSASTAAAAAPTAGRSRRTACSGSPRDHRDLEHPSLGLAPPRRRPARGHARTVVAVRCPGRPPLGVRVVPVELDSRRGHGAAPAAAERPPRRFRDQLAALVGPAQPALELVEPVLAVVAAREWPRVAAGRRRPFRYAPEHRLVNPPVERAKDPAVRLPMSAHNPRNRVIHFGRKRSTSAEIGDPHPPKYAPARGDAQGGRAAPAATRAALSVQASQAGREEALEAHGDGGRRLHDRAVRA